MLTSRSSMLQLPHVVDAEMAQRWFGWHFMQCVRRSLLFPYYMLILQQFRCGIYFKTHGRRLPIAPPDLSRGTNRGTDANSEPDAGAHSNKRRRVNHTADPTPDNTHAPESSLLPTSLVQGGSSRESEAAGTSSPISRESSLTPLPDVPQCAHCHSTKSSNGSWRASRLGGAGPFCNTCLQYERRHARRRPLELVRFHQARRGRGG